MHSHLSCSRLTYAANAYCRGGEQRVDEKSGYLPHGKRLFAFNIKVADVARFASHLYERQRLKRLKQTRVDLQVGYLARTDRANNGTHPVHQLHVVVCDQRVCRYVREPCVAFIELEAQLHGCIAKVFLKKCGQVQRPSRQQHPQHLRVALVPPPEHDGHHVACTKLKRAGVSDTLFGKALYSPRNRHSTCAWLGTRLCVLPKLSLPKSVMSWSSCPAGRGPTHAAPPRRGRSQRETCIRTDRARRVVSQERRGSLTLQHTFFSRGRR